MRAAGESGAVAPLTPVDGRRRGTVTSRFGVSRREGHDASEFYRRFPAPTISDDDEVVHPDARPYQDEIILGDLRERPETVAEGSVALMVTSPPYFSGKEYEFAMGEGHVPADYEAYLEMLHGVLAASARALEPGGRIAVNVANLGRKPYRSLSGDVTDLLQDLGLLLRGEIVWRKAKAAGGSCAWGTYQRPGDPVLRDLTERVIVASKGRFDRAIDPRSRAAAGYPSEASIARDEFLEATTDLWEIPPESATRVGHPAPFPVELPLRLIELYTYRGDLVLDPFIGSGTTAVAALRTDRNFLGYDTDPTYFRDATARVAVERGRLRVARELGPDLWRVTVPASSALVRDEPDEGPLQRAGREGRRARELAQWLIAGSGLEITAEHKHLVAGIDVDFVARDAAGREWCFDVVGTFSATSAGLRRSDVLQRTIGKATMLQSARPGTRYVVLASEVPAPRTAQAKALAPLVSEGSAGATSGAGPVSAPLSAVVDLRSPLAPAALKSLVSETA